MARLLVSRLQTISPLLFLAFAGSVSAQKDTDSLVGTVKDSSGALIPEAKITVAETEKGSINTTTFGTPRFGFLTAARPPRQIQFALKFYY